MIYGYSNKKVNEYGLLEMKEITFSVSPEVLRKIGFFLNEVADSMESDLFQKSSHSHICNMIPNWNELCPDKDIIVIR